MEYSIIYQIYGIAGVALNGSHSHQGCTDAIGNEKLALKIPVLKTHTCNSLYRFSVKKIE
jgi:hypothetical protein